MNLPQWGRRTSVAAPPLREVSLAHGRVILQHPPLPHRCLHVVQFQRRGKVTTVPFVVGVAVP